MKKNWNWIVCARTNKHVGEQTTEGGRFDLIAIDFWL